MVVGARRGDLVVGVGRGNLVFGAVAGLVSGAPSGNPMVAVGNLSAGARRETPVAGVGPGTRCPARGRECVGRCGVRGPDPVLGVRPESDARRMVGKPGGRRALPPDTVGPCPS